MAAIKRLMKDYKELSRNQQHLTSITAAPLESNMLEWHANMCPPDGPYAGVVFHMILKFPPTYI